MTINFYNFSDLMMIHSHEITQFIAKLYKYVMKNKLTIYSFLHVVASYKVRTFYIFKRIEWHNINNSSIMVYQY